MWTIPASGPRKCRYFTLRYRARGIEHPPHKPRAVLTLIGEDAKGKRVTTPMVLDSPLFNDGLWHVLIGRLQAPIHPFQVQVRVRTTDSQGSLELGELQFSESVPQRHGGLDCQNGWNALALPRADFEFVDLSGRFNASTQMLFEGLLKEYGLVSDGIRGLPDSKITVDGVPFSVANSGNDLIRPDDTDPNKGTVQFLGQTVSRQNFFPETRDTTTAFEVNRKISEVFLLLVGDQPATAKRYSVATIPYAINDIDAVAVELQYADGKSDFVFPWSMADRGFSVRRQAGAYAVPCDAQRSLKQVVLHNRLIGKTLCVAAVTFNMSDQRVLPQLVQEPPVVRAHELSDPPVGEPVMENHDGLLTLQNRWYLAEIDCRNGFRIRRLVNRWTPDTAIQLNEHSGLQIRVGNTVLSGSDFKADQMQVSGHKAIIHLTARQDKTPLALTIGLSLDDSPQLRLNLNVTNTGSKPLDAEIAFPYLSGVQLGNLSDTWLYFPAYRIVNTRDHGFFRASNDRAFTVQFYDIYNPVVGCGLSVMTHNRDGAPLDYCVSKNAQGVTASVIYPQGYYTLQPSAPAALTETSLAFHTGDWHEAFDVYRRWLSGWFKRPDAEARAWFSDIWLMQSEVNSDHIARRILKAPSIFDRKAGKYRVEEVLRADRKYYGMWPDVVHFFNWFYSDADQLPLWGAYGEEGMRNAGGRELFCRTIAEIQDQYHLPVSLYTIPNRVSRHIEFGKKYGDKVAAHRPNGSPIQNKNLVMIDPDSDLWRDHFVSALQKLQEETKAKILYLDVFPYSRLEMLSKNAAHFNRVWTNKASNQLLRQLRSALPAGVGVYSEMTPTDLNAGLLDGNICYYNLSLNEYFMRPHDVGEAAKTAGQPIQSIERYAFPQLKQVGFAVGIEADNNRGLCFKPLFFNGEGIYGTTWRLYAGRFREFLKHSLAVRKRYNDCFTTDSPRPLVLTARAGLYANEFPGKDRILWTLYNARYTPIHGKVMTVTHHAGDTYYDAWNGRALKPEIRDGEAILSLDMQPQAIGCVVQQHQP